MLGEQFDVGGDAMGIVRWQNKILKQMKALLLTQCKWNWKYPPVDFLTFSRMAESATIRPSIRC